MANIDLTKLLSANYNTTSPVDSNIKLNKENKQIEYYSDVEFDLKFIQNKDNQLNSSETNKDIKKLINEEAVIQSLKNILNTRYCSRLLNPNLDINLDYYIFNQLDYYTAWFLADDLKNLIARYEPRVRVDNVDIVVHYQEDAYEITLDLSIPSLNASLDFKMLIQHNDGIAFL